MGQTGIPFFLIDVQSSDGLWCRSSAESERDWRDFRVGDHIDALDSVKKWYESLVEDMKQDEIFVNFIGWPSKWNEWISKDSDRLAKKGTHSKKKEEYSSVGSFSSSYTGYSSSTYSYGGWGNSQQGTPQPSGAVGFQNLGNTCFMNSILQSMMHCPVVVDYFRSGQYQGDINLDNPLGWKGKIAEEFAGLIKQYWSDQYVSVAPRQFKNTLGEFQPRFSGYQQQDSSELLSFLLDGLHEDLNLVKKKPPTPAVESNNRPDEVISREAWITYLKRNQSVIVDMFQGQLKSKLICPDPNCGKISITFDPYTFLSLPLPSLAECVVPLHFVPSDPTKSIVIYGVTVPKISRMSDLKAALGQLVSVPGSNIILADISQNRIFRIYQSDDNVGVIRSTVVSFAYECPDIEKFTKSSDYCAVQIVNQELVKNKYWDPSWKYTSEFVLEAFGNPGVIIVPKKGLTVGALRSKVLSVAHSFAQGAEELDIEIRLMSSDMRSCYNCDFYSTVGPRCVGCELKAKQSDDEEFDLKFDKVENETKLGITLVWKNKAKQVNQLRENSIQKHSSAELTGTTKKAESIPLTKCLEAFALPEVLSGDDLYYCSGCKVFQPATKQMAVWSAPQILVIHLKRFSYSRVSRDKITTLVEFPLEGLDLTPYLQSKCGAGTGELAIYDCFAVSNHMGGLMGGHYHAFIRNLTTGDWYLHNDSSVAKVQDKTEIVSSSAYVIFYQLRGTKRVKNLLDGENNLTLQTANGDSLASEVQKIAINSSHREIA
jgi:ubiquitin C-terminal hydrolase